MLGFILLCYSNYVRKIFNFKKCHDLENLVKDPWRSLKMSPFDRVHMTSYWRSIVISNYGSISCRFWDIQYRKNIATLKSHSRANQGHWKWFHFTDWLWLILGKIIKKFCYQKSDFKAKMHQIRVNTLPCEKHNSKNWVIIDTTPRSEKNYPLYIFSFLPHDTTHKRSLFRRLVSVCPVGALYSHRWRYHQTSFSAL